MDNNKLVRIARKHNAKGSVKQWELPDPEVSRMIRKSLRRNNKTNNKHVNKIVEKLSRKQLLPRHLDVGDFDDVFQKDKAAYLNNLYSNQLNIIKNLKKEISIERAEYKKVKKSVDLFKKEVQVLISQFESGTIEGIDSEFKDNTLHLNHRVVVGEFLEEEANTSDLTPDNSEKEDTDQIDRLLEYTSMFSSACDKLDELNDIL